MKTFLMAAPILLIGCAAHAQSVGTPGTPSTSLAITAMNAGTGAPPKNWRFVVERVDGEIEVVDRFENKSACEAAQRKALHERVTDEQKAYGRYFDSQADKEFLPNRTAYVAVAQDIHRSACLDW
jgi:hypothetical protein